jgi:hypothetical protein
MLRRYTSSSLLVFGVVRHAASTTTATDKESSKFETKSSSSTNFYNMKATGRTTTSSFDGSSSNSGKKQAAEEEKTKHDNFFKRRDTETEQAAKDPRSFRQEQGKALKFAQYMSNVFFVLFMGSLVVCVGVFQYIYSQGFGLGLESIVGSKRKNYWTRRNEAVDTKLHNHSSFADMLGLKWTTATSVSDDQILEKAKAYKADKEAKKQAKLEQQ